MAKTLLLCFGRNLIKFGSRKRCRRSETRDEERRAKERERSRGLGRSAADATNAVIASHLFFYAPVYNNHVSLIQSSLDNSHGPRPPFFLPLIAGIHVSDTL